jgi:hypothetical protein
MNIKKSTSPPPAVQPSPRRPAGARGVSSRAKSPRDARCSACECFGKEKTITNEYRKENENENRIEKDNSKKEENVNRKDNKVKRPEKEK